MATTAPSSGLSRETKMAIGIVLLVVFGPLVLAALLLAIIVVVVVVVGAVGGGLFAFSTKSYVSAQEQASIERDLRQLDLNAQRRAGEQIVQPCRSEAEARAALTPGWHRGNTLADPSYACLEELGLWGTLRGEYWLEVDPVGIPHAHVVEDWDGDGAATHWTVVDGVAVTRP